MSISPLRKLINTRLADGKIDPDDARAILRKVKEDVKFSPAEIRELKRLAAMPKSTFVTRDEYIPNPLDPEDGVTIKANPKKWIEHTLGLATAKLKVVSTVPGVTVSLGKPTMMTEEDFGDYMARKLTLTIKGGKATTDGKVEFTYGKCRVSVPVTKGTEFESIFNRIQAQLIKNEDGSLSSEGYFDRSKAAPQKVNFILTSM